MQEQKPLLSKERKTYQGKWSKPKQVRIKKIKL